MINSVKTLLTGLICIVVLMRSNTCDASHHNCEIHHLARGINVDCSDKKVYWSVPANLPVEMRSLDLSDNNLCDFTRDNFTNYVSLQELLMRNLICKERSSYNSSPDGIITLANDTFADLVSLQLLDLTSSPICAFGTMRFQWPTQLNFLIMDHVSRVAFDFTELKALEHLSAVDCEKYVFPTLHPYAPLRTINLQTNKLSFLNVELLANYCSIKVLAINEWSDTFNEKIEGTFEAEHMITEVSCMCERVKEWAKQKDIDGLQNLECPTTVTISGVVHKNTTPCDMSFETANFWYNKCVERIGLENYLSWFRILIVIVFIIMIVIPASFITVKAWSIYKGRRSLIIRADPFGSEDYSSFYEFESDHEFWKRGSSSANERWESERTKSDSERSSA